MAYFAFMYQQVEIKQEAVDPYRTTTLVLASGFVLAAQPTPFVI